MSKDTILQYKLGAYIEPKKKKNTKHLTNGKTWKLQNAIKSSILNEVSGNTSKSNHIIPRKACQSTLFLHYIYYYILLYNAPHIYREPFYLLL